MSQSPEWPSSPENDYFRAIEEIFVRLRGAPMLLSPADWQIAKGWHERRIPLALIERVLHDVFERRRLRDAKSKVQGLRYCARAVESAWAEAESLAAPLERRELEPLDPRDRLRRLTRWLPDDLPDRGRWQRRILETVSATIRANIEPLPANPAPGSPGPTSPGPDLDLEAIERALTLVDGELLEAAFQGLSPRAKERVLADVEHSVEAFGSRAAGSDPELARRRLLARRVRSELRLPVLSLFSAEAMEPETDRSLDSSPGSAGEQRK